MIPFWFLLWKLVLLSIFPGLSLFLFYFCVSAFITAKDETSTTVGAILYRVVLFAALLVLFSASGTFYYSKAGVDWKEKLLESYSEYSKSTKEEIRKESIVAPTKVMLPREIHQFYLVEFNPPKHVYVSIEHVNSGVSYNHLYVSKHCSTTPVTHDTYNVVVQPYYMSDNPKEIKWEFPNLYQEFCN